MAPYGKPLPRVREQTRGFWAGCKRHELRIQRCRNCGRFRFPPLLMCPKCNSTVAEWAAVSGKGKIYSFIVPHHHAPGEPPARGFDYPYAVVLVELPDAGGVRIASNMVDCKIADIEIGMPVEVVFDDITEEITLPKFRPSPTSA